MRMGMIAGMALLLAGCAGQSERTARATQEMVPAGDPISCINIVQIRNTQVIDDQTIDFIMRDGTILRNNLPQRCPGLGFERAFSYNTSINQLCNVNIITVINQGGRPMQGASCGLGMFQPVTPKPKPAE